VGVLLPNYSSALQDAAALKVPPGYSPRCEHRLHVPLNGGACGAARNLPAR
jgi:hypothetical protein